MREFDEFGVLMYEGEYERNVRHGKGILYVSV